MGYLGLREELPELQNGMAVLRLCMVIPPIPCNEEFDRASRSIRRQNSFPAPATPELLNSCLVRYRRKFLVDRAEPASQIPCDI